ALLWVQPPVRLNERTRAPFKILERKNVPLLSSRLDPHSVHCKNEDKIRERGAPMLRVVRELRRQEPVGMVVANNLLWALNLGMELLRLPPQPPSRLRWSFPISTAQALW